MNNTTNVHYEAALLAADQIAENFCLQLIAIQKSINTRPDGLQSPTTEETMMQCKLINCLDKIRRFSGRTVPRKTNKSEEIKTTPVTAAVAVTPRKEITTIAQQEMVPVSEQDFEDYQYVLGNIGFVEDDSTITFRNNFVNAKWLEYNLFQYCLPVASRHFINDVNEVLETIDYETLRQTIRAWKKSLERAA